MQASFSEFLQSSRFVTNIGLGVLSLVSGYFTYLGAVMVLGGAGGFSAQALVYASGVTALIFVFWHYVLHIVPRLQTAKTRILGVGVIALGGLFIIALSSWMNVMALAGGGAQDALLRDMTRQLDVVFQAAANQSNRLDSIEAELSLTANRYGDIAKSEIERGALTGSPGRGRVADSLLASKATIDRLLSSLHANAEAREALIRKGDAILLRLDGLSEEKMEAGEKSLSFKRELSALNEVIAGLAVNGEAQTVARTMRTLASQADLFAGSTNRALAKTQEAVIERVSEELAETGERIAKAADEVAGMTSVTAPVLDRLGIAKAVFLYAGDLVPYWAGGIGMDLMPIALVLLLMLLFITSRQMEPVDPDVGDMPFRIVQKLFFELERMKQTAEQEALAPYREQAMRPALADKTLPRAATETGAAKKEDAADAAAKPWTEADEEAWKRHAGA